MTKPQLGLFKELYHHLLAGEAVELDALGPTAHRVLLSSFTLSLNARNQVDSAVEQSMIFSLMAPTPGRFLSALSHTQLFARSQRTIFTTFFHTAWHGGPDCDFKLDDRANSHAHAQDSCNVDDDEEPSEIEAGKELDRETDEVEESVDFCRFGDQVPTMRVDDVWDDEGMFDVSGVKEATSDDGDMGMEILTGRDGDDALLTYVLAFAVLNFWKVMISPGCCAVFTNGRILNLPHTVA